MKHDHHSKKSRMCSWHMTTRRLLMGFVILSLLVAINLISSKSLITVSRKRDSRYLLWQNLTNINRTHLNKAVRDVTPRGLMSIGLTSVPDVQHSKQTSVPDIQHSKQTSVAAIQHSKQTILNTTVSSENNVPALSSLKISNVTILSRRIVDDDNSVRKDTDVEVTSAPMETDDISADISDVGNGPESVNIYGNYQNSVNSTHRRNSCNRCFEHNFKYVIESNDICKLTSPNDVIDIVILIMTTHRNYQARNAIRTTWLLASKENTANVRYVFLLGETNDDRYHEQVLQESIHFRDIVKEDFVDSYANLTYKTIMGFKWVATKCAHARFVMKTDDDMFVNVPNLLKLVESNSSILQTSIGGACNQKAAPIRNRRSKWYASHVSYPDRFYPGYCSGTGYVTSSNVAQRIYQISPSVPFFHLEDVYVSLCIHKIRYKLIRLPGFHTDRPRMDGCIYKGTTLITGHRLSPLMLRMIWERACMPRRRVVPFRYRVRHTNRYQ